jgi:hypothetical protein
MVAANATLTIEQGSTFSRTIIWKDSSDTPINLTGYTAYMLIDPNDGSSDYVLSTANGKIVITPLEGKLVLTISSTDTDSFTWPSARYELQVDSGVSITRLLQGGIILSPSIIP